MQTAFVTIFDPTQRLPEKFVDLKSIDYDLR